MRCEVSNEKSTVQSLSKSFALQIIYLYRHLDSNKREFVLSKQLLRSGTSIGANIKEAQFAQSRADFIAQMYQSHDSQQFIQKKFSDRFFAGPFSLRG